MSNLRAKRIEEGLTQEQLADLVGVSIATVSRWEAGKNMPMPLYAAKLARILHTHPEDLGLIRQGSHRSQPPHLASTPIPIVAASSFSSSAIRDPLLPPRPFLIGREQELQWIKDALAQLVTSHTHQSRTVVLSGLAGIGKTTLLAALAHEQEIPMLFPDGILWAHLGGTSDLSAIMHRWEQLLQMNVLEDDPFVAEDETCTRLHHALAHQRWLLLLDDVWNKKELSLLLSLLGEEAACIFTTRLPWLATVVANAQVLTIPPFSLENGREILAHLVPTLPQERYDLTSIIEAVGGHPLVLTLMGQYLQQETYSQQPRRIQAALTHLHDATTRLALPLPDHRAISDRHTADPGCLQTVLSRSFEQLPALAQDALSALALLPTAPASFSEKTALTVAACTEETLDTLVDSGLLLLTRQRYQIHPLIRDYASCCLVRAEQIQSAALTRLLTSVLARLEQNEQTHMIIAQELLIFQTAFDLAWKYQRYQEAFCLTEWLTAFWLAQEAWEEAEACFTRALAVARQQMHHPQYAVHCLLGLGYCALARHQRLHAHDCYMEALVYARRGEADEECLLLTLIKVAAVALYMADFYTAIYAQEAKTYCEEAFALLQRRPLLSQRSAVLQVTLPLLYEMFGTTILEEEGTLAALEYYRQGLEVAAHFHHHEVECWLLFQQGTVLLYREEYEASEQSLRQALALAHQHHLNSLMSLVFARLLDVMLLTNRLEEGSQILARWQAISGLEDKFQGQHPHERLMFASSSQQTPAWIAVYTGRLALVQQHLQAARQHYETAFRLASSLPANGNLLRHILHDQTVIALKKREVAEALACLGELQRLVPSSLDVLWQGYIYYRRAQLLALIGLPPHEREDVARSRAIFRKRDHLLGLHDLDAWVQHTWEETAASSHPNQKKFMREERCFFFVQEGTSLPEQHR